MIENYKLNLKKKKIIFYEIHTKLIVNFTEFFLILQFISFTIYTFLSIYFFLSKTKIIIKKKHCFYLFYFNLNGRQN